MRDLTRRLSRLEDRCPPPTYTVDELVAELEVALAGCIRRDGVANGKDDTEIDAQIEAELRRCRESNVVWTHEQRQELIADMRAAVARRRAELGIPDDSP